MRELYCGMRVELYSGVSFSDTINVGEKNSFSETTDAGMCFLFRDTNDVGAFFLLVTPPVQGHFSFQ